MALLISSSVTSVTIAALFSSSEINGSCPCFVTQGSTLTVQLKFTHYPMFVYITRSSDIAIRFSGSFSNSLCRSMTSSGFVLLSYSTLCDILFELCTFFHFIAHLNLRIIANFRIELDKIGTDERKTAIDQTVKRNTHRPDICSFS